MNVAVRVGLAVFGIVCVVAVLDAAVRTFVLPRGVAVRFTWLIVTASRKLFETFARPARDWNSRDRVMALYAPITLLLFPAVWLVGVLVGCAALFAAIDDDGARAAVSASGSALFTLGFATPHDMPSILLTFTEAAIGLALLALLISYIPSIYGAFSRREIVVSQLSVRAGTPPTAVELLERAHRSDFLNELDRLFEQWEAWFVEIGETQTSFAVLNFFRSPHPNRSWVTAGGAVLDAAALTTSALDRRWSPRPALCIRSGYMALREIADLFGVRHDPDPQPGDPISVSRDEFDELCDRLAAAGLAMKPDRDQAWKDFCGWRVNYDTVLLALADLVMAPYAPWSSDRSPAPSRRVPLRERGMKR